VLGRLTVDGAGVSGVVRVQLGVLEQLVHVGLLFSRRFTVRREEHIYI
jgi:hypothetical protein